MRRLISGLFLLVFLSGCFSTRNATEIFFIPEPCSLISKQDITKHYQIRDPQEIRISVSISMSADSKLCAYGWEDDSKVNYILDLFISGQENLKTNSPYGTLDFYTQGQNNVETLQMGDASVYIPSLDGGSTSRLVLIRGDYALDIQSTNIEKDILIEFAANALEHIP